MKRLQPLAGDGTEQGELFATYRHHAFITNSTLGTVKTDQRHRDYALIEHVIAEIKDSPLAHLLSENTPRTLPGSLTLCSRSTSPERSRP